MTGMEEENFTESGNFVGPLFTLVCLLLSVISSAFFGINIGDTSCRYRLDYSPHARTFGIWTVIYGGCVVVCIVHAAVGLNVLSQSVFVWWGVCWLCCGAWVPLFDDVSLWLLSSSLVVLAAGAVAASLGTAAAEAWVPVASEPSEQHYVTLSVAPLLEWPLSLLAGWLLTASALNFGIVLKAADPESSETCVLIPPQKPDETNRQFRARKRALIREANSAAPAAVAYEVWLLSYLVAIFSMLTRSPVLAIPPIWAISNMRAFPSYAYTYAIVVCALGSGGAVAAASV